MYTNHAEKEIVGGGSHYNGNENENKPNIFVRFWRWLKSLFNL